MIKVYVINVIVIIDYKEVFIYDIRLMLYVFSK